MTLNLHFESAFPSIVETAAQAINGVAKDFSNSIIISLIVEIRNKNRELKDLLIDVEENPTILLGKDNEPFYDQMNGTMDNLERLLNLSEKNKDKSDVFMQLYHAVDDLYTTVIVVSNEIAFSESNILHEKMKNAS